MAQSPAAFPLGSAALAGTAFPIDRQFTTKELNFTAPSSNSIDAVSDRDFVMEFLSVSSITSIHISRLSEEIVIWCSDQFNFIKLSDKFSTGSSIMPQKRNPDAAELARGKSGRIIGSLMSILMVLGWMVWWSGYISILQHARPLSRVGGEPTKIPRIRERFLS